MIYALVLFLIVGLSWFIYFTAKRRLGRLESAAYSAGLAIGLPVMLLILAATISIPVNSSSVLVCYALAVVAPFAWHSTGRFRRNKNTNEPKNVEDLPGTAPNNAIAQKSVAIILGGALLIASFAIISAKWYNLAEENALIHFGTDVARLSAVTQVIVATEKIPAASDTIHVDTGVAVAGGMPFEQVFESVPLILENENISSVVNYSSLVFLILGAFLIFTITYATTKRYDISGLASLLFGAALVFMYPNNSAVASYTMFPLVFYAAIRYIQQGSRLSLFLVFIFGGMLFLTHHGTTLFGMVVFLFMIIISSITGSKQLKERSMHASLVVIVWFALVAAIYVALFDTSFNEFLRFYTGYWQYPVITSLKELEVLASSVYLAVLFSPLVMYLAYRRLSSFNLSSKLHGFGKAHEAKLILAKDIAIFVVAGSIVILFFAAATTESAIGNHFLFDLTRDTNLAFLPVTIAALAFFFVRTEKVSNHNVGLLVAYCILFFVGVLSISFVIPAIGDTTERLIPFTHPILAVFAAISVMAFTFRTRKSIQLAAILAVASMTIFAISWSFGAIDRYYRSDYRDFVTQIENFKQTDYKGETIAYDFAYVTTFMHPDPDIFVDRRHLPPHDEMAALLRENNVSYVLSSQTEGYWQNVLDSGFQYEIVSQSPTLTIYRINP